jgi:hypothetical protein
MVWDTIPGQPEPYDDFTGHGTMVAGMAAGEAFSSQALEPTPGDDLGQRFYLSTGVAPKAKMIIQKIFVQTASGSKLANRSMRDWMDHAKTLGADAQTQSRNQLSAGYTPGIYSLMDQEYDAAIREINLPTTTSSGNKYSVAQSFPNATTTRVPSPGLAKNIITVGGTDGYRASGPSCGVSVDVAWRTAESLSNIAYLSRRGTTDGRIKPEVVAPATFVSSTRRTNPTSIYCTTGLGSSFDTLYAVSSGTSFASPQVGASILLLNTKLAPAQRYTAALAKAAIVATATSLRGGVDKQSGSLIGAIPDSTTGQGFGKLSLSKLVGNGWTRTALDEASWTPFTAAGQTRTAYFTIASLGKPTAIALAWNDPEAAAGANPTLVRDLNLQVDPASCCGSAWYRGNKFTSLDYSTASPSSFDSKNNVELIVLPPSVGFTSFLVTVTANTLPGVGDQKFALFLLNAQ